MLDARNQLSRIGLTLTNEQQVAAAEKVKEITLTNIERFSVESWLSESREKIPLELQSSSFLTARYTTDSVGSITTQLANINLNAGNYAGFVIWYDMSYGASQISGNIESAEMIRKSPTDAENFIHEAVSLVEPIMHGHEADTAHHAGTYLYLRALIGSSMKLLEEDPSGFLLVDQLIEYVNDRDSKIPGRFASPGMQQIVSRGAALAAETYKSIYPQIDQLLMKDR